MRSWLPVIFGSMAFIFMAAGIFQGDQHLIAQAQYGVTLHAPLSAAFDVRDVLERFADDEGMEMRPQDRIVDRSIRPHGFGMVLGDNRTERVWTNYLSDHQTYDFAFYGSEKRELMRQRALDLIARLEERWPGKVDQLFTYPPEKPPERLKL